MYASRWPLHVANAMCGYDASRTMSDTSTKRQVFCACFLIHSCLDVALEMKEVALHRAAIVSIAFVNESRDVVQSDAKW